jgi:DNA-binding PadR family transcriptional regulator
VSRRRPESSPQTRSVLRALHDEPGWSYGYDISRLTGIKSGTLYPMLSRLAERGLLEATWEQPTAEGRPPRHLYRLTDAGADLARSLRAESVAPRRFGASPAGLGEV